MRTLLSWLVAIFSSVAVSLALLLFMAVRYWLVGAA